MKTDWHPKKQLVYSAVLDTCFIK